MNNIRVYQMNDCEWWASKLDKRATLNFYLKETCLTEEENPIEEVRECDIDKEGMWWETDDPEDIERLGDADEIIEFVKINGQTRSKVLQLGNLQRIYGKVFKLISFREALEKHGDFTEPFCLASTEW